MSDEAITSQKMAGRATLLVGTVGLLAAIVLTACSKPDARNPALQKLGIEEAPGMQFMSMVGYDDDIHREGSGEPVQKADKSWTEFWLRIMAAREADAAKFPQRSGDDRKYVRSIVACRRAAGLPDLPNHPSVGVSTPGGCNVSGVVAADAEAAAHPGQTRRSGDWVVWSSKQAAHP